MENIIGNLQARDKIIDKDFETHSEQMGRHRSSINQLIDDVNVLDERVGKTMEKVFQHEDRLCRCGTKSSGGDLDELEYAEPHVASGSGSSESFREDASPIPIPVPGSSFPPADQSLPPSSAGPSDKENVVAVSGEAAPMVVDLVEIVSEVGGDAEAELVSDALDAEVCSRLYQRCKSKNHPSRFHPYKGRGNGRSVGRRGFQHVGAKVERRKRTKDIIEGINGDADEESGHESGSDREVDLVPAGGSSSAKDDGSFLSDLRSSGPGYGFLRRSIFLSA